MKEKNQSLSISTNWKFLIRIAIKTVVLFLTFNLAFVWLFPMTFLGKISGYNGLFPGRERFPFGESPDKAYNLTLNNIEAMFASHKINASDKPENEYRVILLGDSSVWGYWLENKDTLSAYLNALELKTSDGMEVVFYNLGYPTISLTKDLMILEIAKRYHPDMFIWLTTLEAFPYEKQLFTPLVQENPEIVELLLARYGLTFPSDKPVFREIPLLEKSIVGQRRDLADLLRLQTYGILWASTGIDQDIPRYESPEDYKTRAEDLEPDSSFHDLTEPLMQKDLAFEMLAAGVKASGNIPLIIVNEPMFISQGENSDIRYNFFYPRWAYDEYRTILISMCEENGWTLLDLWDVVPASEFTNSAIHLTPAGSKILADQMGVTLVEILP
ncbi:MAG: SGNH/GDSL hydrolase family protein [Anaerolineales bacterium]|nr:SGNH/GDSL hydrolase family protein [Anaerolineales bacterium]